MIAPVPDADSAPYWEALEEGRLLVPLCGSCAGQFFPPMPSCPLCGSSQVGWTSPSGAATAYSWATIRIPLHPAFSEDAPYTVVIGELAEGGRITGRLLDDVPLSDGTPLRFEVYRVDGQALPGFRAPDGTVRAFRGVVVQHLGGAWGHFLGTTDALHRCQSSAAGLEEQSAGIRPPQLSG